MNKLIVMAVAALALVGCASASPEAIARDYWDNRNEDAQAIDCILFQTKGYQAWWSSAREQLVDDYGMDAALEIGTIVREECS